MLHSAKAPVPSIRLFQQYCAELINLKLVAETAPIPTTPDAESTEPASGTQQIALGRPAAVWSRLELLLERQTLEASRIAGPVGVEFHREALYVMAALTDETFVHLEWEGRQYWLSHLFEARFFRTHFAGEGFFSHIDALLQRDDDPAAETATVYLMALALGFRGKYWGPEHESVIESYRSRLFFFVARRDPEIAESLKRLYPDAYRHTIQPGAPHKLPNPRRWLLIFGGAVILWLVLTQALWSNLTSELSHKVCCLTPECSQSCVSTGSTK
jgi:type VI secretion system protein ImpK